MSLAVGDKMGPYEILAPIGEGGMGKVFRARDIRLDRTVAIKVSKAEFGERFVREAKSVAALNHPNICTLHDVGPNYLVLELIEGTPLKGPLPVEKAVEYALQILDALDAAHRKGFVHRDLKPANVMVTKHGIKLLDFGLARQTASLAETDPTRTVVKDDIAGTPQYMAPEQLQGKKVDGRSDLFAFGCVFYELLSGRRAFAGATGATVIAAILDREPAPIDVNPALSRVIRKCLAKDPDERFQTARDLKTAISWAAEPPPLVTPRNTRRWWPLAVAVTAGVILTAAWLYLWPAAQPSTVVSMRRMTFDAGLNLDGVLSPDGRLVAFASDQAGQGNLDLWVQQVDGRAAIRLTDDPEDDYQPSFSPDGTKIVFRSDRNGGGIYEISALGGHARQIVNEGYSPSYSPDGKLIAYTTFYPGNFTNARAYFVTPMDGGAKRELPGFLARPGRPLWVGARHLLVNSGQEGKPAERWIVPIETPKAALLVGMPSGLPRPFQVSGWDIARGQIIATAGTDAWGIAIDASSGKVKGRAERLILGSQAVQRYASAGNRAAVSFTNQYFGFTIYRLDGSGEERRMLEDAAEKAWPEISRDGKHAVFSIFHQGSGSSIWDLDVTSGKARPLITAPGANVHPSLSPDTHNIYYKTTQNVGELRVSSFRGGTARTLNQRVGRFANVSPDGRFAIHYTGSPAVCSLLDIETGRNIELLNAGDRSTYEQRFSSDGRWITFITKKGDVTQVFAAPFQGFAPIARERWIPLTEGDSNDDKPRLALDLRRLYFISRRDGFLCIYQRDLDPATLQPRGDISAFRHLHEARHSLNSVDLSYLEISVSADSMLVNSSNITGSIWLREESTLSTKQ
jgi:Tol biopolymer transport system component